MGGLGVLGVVAALSAPPAETSRVELIGYASVGVVDYQVPSRLVFGEAGAQVIVFVPRALKDDGAPYSMQPFLQRAGEVWLSASGSGSQFDVQGYSSHGRSGGARAGFDVYVHPWIALAGSFSIGGGDGEDLSSLPHHNWGISGTLGLGVRWEDTRFDVSYALSGNRVDGLWQPVFYGSVHLGATLAVQRKMMIALNIDLIDDGAVASGGLEGFIGKRLGLYVVAGGGGAHPGAPMPYRSAFVRVGVAPWTSRHFGANLQYQITWSNGASDGTIQHLFTLELRTRQR